MLRRVQIIANPIAGGGRGASVAPTLAKLLESRGLATDVFFTQKAGDASERAAALRADDYFAVVAMGGDGTVNEVLNGMTDFGVRLATLPLGTGNVLACELRLPKDPVRCAAAIDHGRTIEASIGTANGRRFLLFVGYGLDAQMAARLSEVRSPKFGKLKWFAPALHVARKWDLDTTLRVVTSDGRTVEALSQVLVTRVRNYGGVFELTEGISIEDAKLHVLCFRQRSRWQFVVAAWRAFRGKLRAGRDCEVLVADALRVEADRPVPCQIDGDPHSPTPHEVRIDGTVQLIVDP